MTDEQKRKMEWLDRAENAEKYMNALKEQIAQDKQLADILSEYGNPDAVKLKQKVERGIQEQKEKMAELVNFREEIRKAIARLHDDELEAILTRRHLLYESNRIIAEQMFFDVRTIQRKHIKALNKLVIPQLYQYSPMSSRSESKKETSRPK